MNYEILKEISETFYININDIKSGIIEKSPNIYMRFRTASEELLLQINKKYEFVQEGEGFYNRIINNSAFQLKMLSDYKCDRKIMSSINRIKDLGNQNTHNTLKIFDINDVKEILFRLLLLARKVLENERNILNSFNFTREDINNEVDSLIDSVINNPKPLTTKEKFVEAIHQYDGDLVLLYPEFYQEKDKEFLVKYKELVSIILNYIISYSPKYKTLEDLCIGKYSSLYQIYKQLSSLDNEDFKTIKSNIYDYTFIIRKVLINEYDIDILEWILSLPFDNELNEANLDSTYNSILNAVNAITNSDNFDYDSKLKYYVESQKQVICDKDYYYVIELKPAVGNLARGNTVYSKVKLPNNYALEISLKEVNIDILGCSQKEYVVVDYRISIRPAELNRLIFAITGKKVRVASSGKLYTTLMNYLQNNQCSILDVLISEDKIYNDFISNFKDLKEDIFNVIKETMDKARRIIKDDKFESGANILRYFTYYLRLNVLKKQCMKERIGIVPESFNDLYFNKGAYRFDRNPFSFNLKEHIPAMSTLYECIDYKNYESDILVRKLAEARKQQDTLFIDLKDYPNNSKELIQDYNNKILNTYNNLGKLGIIDNYIYRIDEKDKMKRLIHILENQKINEDKKLQYERAKDQFLKENKLDSINKIDILNNSFKESKITVILGEAGTGKTELICNYFTNIFDFANKDNEKFKILYVANTHAALNNLKRRVKLKAPNAYKNSVFRTAKSIANNFNNFNINNSGVVYSTHYDLVIMDECKTIANSEISKIFDILSFDNCILAGDIKQLDAIDLGNWFNIISEKLPDNCVYKLSENENYRTVNSELRTVWKLVRDNEQSAIDYLKEHNYIEDISNKIFDRIEEHEIILCLNYSGTYGIKAINEYFQSQNPNKAFRNAINVYKVDDPVVFNQNANDSKKYKDYIYNNLTGIIKDIKEDDDKILFTLKVDTFIPLNEDTRKLVITSNEIENWSYIKILLKKYTEDHIKEDDESDYICPFEVIYAMSIHKAQGLEFDSVKIIITPESEEVINNAVFYTAITRTKKHLKIYMTKNNQEKMIDIISKKNKTHDVELLEKLD